MTGDSSPQSASAIETPEPTRKLALGLFHFNVQYVAGNIAGYHRYCSQAILPFLDVFKRNPTFRASFELCGSGLEFLAKHYPTALADLQMLISRQQLELISSTYIPSLWIAFPLRDLIWSININRRRLAALGLKPADIFFSQEAFFGQGLSVVEDLFSAVVCKDEFLRHQIPDFDFAKSYSLARMRVVVGANHLLNAIARIAQKKPASSIGKAALGSYGERVRKAMQTLPADNEDSGGGRIQNLSWHWYHLGSGHHFTTPHGPENMAQFFADARWTSMNESILRDLQSRNYTLSTIGDFLTATRAQVQTPLPTLVEGSWNSKRSRGIFTWMNHQEKAWHQNTSILGLAWRSRHEVRRCEQIIEKLPAENKGSFLPHLESVWTKQLTAESSDPCGWSPLPGEVRFGLDAAESALEAAQAFRFKLCTQPGSVDQLSQFHDEIGVDESAGIQCVEFELQPTLIDAEGSIEIYPCSKQAKVCAVSAVATQQAKETGVSFPLKGTTISYCPSGQEEEVQTLDLAAIRCDELYLPLTNGLIGIGDGLYIIRVNRHGQPAARISPNSSVVTFKVVGSVASKSVAWRFIIFNGSEDDAVTLANQINDI